MELLSYDIDELYQQARDKALAEGAFSPEEWSDVIDLVLQEREQLGEIHDDDEISAVKEQLRGKYEDFKSEIPES